MVCLPDTADCDQDSANGCETNLLVDPGNCGACGQRCATDPDTGNHAIYTCDHGYCNMVGCQPHWAACSLSVGCPYNLLTDPHNCGACYNECDVNAGQACIDGTCK